MIISRCDVRPSSACKSPEKASAGDKLGQCRVRPSGQNIPEKDKGEARTGGYRNEDLENGALRVAVANGSGNGREPFVRKAVVFILHNLFVV